MNKISASLILLLLSFFANAQKLPNIQTASLRAPANVKIDGKAGELNNQFQAYNKVTDVFYTLVNDDQKLYLTIKATDESIIKKIVMGGLTLSINNTNKRDIKNAVAITFPVYDINYPPSYFNFNKSKIAEGSNVDSLMIVYNKTLSSKYKLIGVSGMENITDSLLSVYNEYGIKTVALLDKQLNYTYEMAIPLKYLNLNDATKITYNIKINAASIGGRKLEVISPRANLNLVVFTGADGATYQMGNDPQSMALVGATDFWGEYTLAK